MSDQAISETQTARDDAVTSIEAGAFGSFTGGVALTLATRLLMLLGVIGSSVIVARWLGPEGFGTLAVLTATVALAVQLGSAGLPSSNTYLVARDRKLLGPIWANSLVFAFVGGTLLILTVVGLAKLSPALLGNVPLRLVLIAALSIPFQLIFILGLNVLLAMDRIGWMNLLDSMLPALILLNAVVVLLILHSTLPVLVTFNTGAAILMSAWILWVIARILSNQRDRIACRPDADLFKGAITYGLKFSISAMSAILIFRTGVLVVNHFRDAAEAGVYAVASQVANLLLMLPGVVATLLFPRLASYRDQGGEFAVRVTRHASLVMLMMCLAAAAGSFLLPLVYGPRFADATIQLLILLPGIYLVGIESVLVQHFTGIGLPVAIPVFWVVTLAVNIGLNLALVPAFGGRGAAYASASSYALIFVLVVVYFRVKTGNKLSAIFLLRPHELRDLFARIRPGSKANLWIS
jgi:O-antigen/teichoic acid export membrane protein